MIARAWKLARGGAGVSIVSLYLGVVCNLALTFFAGGWFGQRTFGFIVIGLSVTLIGAMLGQFGFSHGLVKLIGAYRATDDKPMLRGAIRGVPAFCFATGLVLALLSWGVLLLIPMTSQLHTTLRWAIACIPVWTLMLLLQHVARGFQRMGLANLPSTVVHPLLLIAVCLFFTEQRTAAFFFQAYAAIGLIVAIGLMAWLRGLPEIRELKTVAPRYDMRHWLVMSYPIGISVVQNQILQRSDALILSGFVSPEQVGLYGMASRVAMGVGQCKIAFNRYWAASMAGRWEVRDLLGLKRVVRRTAQLSLAVSITIAVVLVLWGKWILRLPPGEDFSQAYALMMILLVGHLFMAYFAPNITLLQMADQERSATRNYAIALAIVLVSYFAIIPWAGAVGGAAVTSGGMVLLSLLMMRSCMTKLNCYPGAF